MALRYLLVLLLTSLTAHGVCAQVQRDLSFLTTRAESSEYEETTRYDEVMAFLDVASATAEDVYLTTFGYSYEGRPLPLVVVGNVRTAKPAAVRQSRAVRVLVQANIHGGEVAGKEAALMLVRKLAAGGYEAWRDSLVLLIAPIYNADGNERVRLDHRPYQLGPIGGMGQRANAQGYDLNRDHMKLDSPEARSLVRLLDHYDPHVVIDLHTTNGTRHAYHLTYSPPLHPDTPTAIDSLLWTEWLPQAGRGLRAHTGWETYHYGNVPRAGMDAQRGWYTFDYRPRFNNNYVGLRNRFAILSEAYAYAPFDERVHATLYFVEEVLDRAVRHAVEIRAAASAADSASMVGRQLTLRARHEALPQPVDILLGEVDPVRHVVTGDTLYRRRDVKRGESMPAYVRFRPVEQVVAPSAYLVPPELTVVHERLAAHGVRFDVLDAPQTRTVERFRIDSSHVAEDIYEGHRRQTLFGAYEESAVELTAGTLVVPVDQPLGRLVFQLLEPRAADGLASWRLIEAQPSEAPSDRAGTYPITRLPARSAPRAE